MPPNSERFSTHRAACIAPQSVCRPLVEKGSDLVICHLAEEPPVRIARIIIHRHLPEEKRRLVELFERELRACPVPDEDTPAGRRKSGRRAQRSKNQI